MGRDLSTCPRRGQISNPSPGAATRALNRRRSAGRNNPMIAHAAAIFCSAFLLFQIQPLAGKELLPWFGGSAAVWSACLVFFQTVLFLGYLYAHVVGTRM